MTVIHWFRRDLRLADNTALDAALSSGLSVVPVFIFDPAILASPRAGLPRLALLLKALTALDESLRQRNSRLLIRQGDPRCILPVLAAELGATALYFNRDYTPYARRRDDEIGQLLEIPLHIFDDALIHAPGEIVKDDRHPYTVYTPFKKRWLSLPKPGMRESEGRFHALESVYTPPVPSLRELGFVPTIEAPNGSEAHALKQLEAFVDGVIYDYAEDRNRLIATPFSSDTPQGTSALSPYLRLGMLSPRQVYHAARRAQTNTANPAAQHSVDMFISELAWRDFYMHILFHFPHVVRDHFRPEFDAVQYRHAPDELQAWKEGRTGFPLVDAAMRQLTSIGWMHNRARMMVASFLTKHLLIHWREGELFFLQCLLDGDPAANNGGWQWSAGTGTDAQPYFRIFNPVSQSRKFDPSGDYIRRWIPELRDVQSEFIHTPWEMPNPPKGYPPPLVDVDVGRVRALQAFDVLKQKA